MLTIQLPSPKTNPKDIITPSDDRSDEQPCEKYLQFMDSSHQERTFMIEKLIETFANVIDSIWQPKFLDNQSKVVPTRGFINEILKRSKATYSTVQISLFYIFRVKKAVQYKLQRKSESSMNDLMCCGRRMFLASLMLASKYLHDRNYQNKAWAQLTGLKLEEINAAEMAFLSLIDYRLYVSKPTFDKWYTQLHGHIQKGYNNNINNNINDKKQQYNRTDSGVSLLSPPTSQDEKFSTKKREYVDDDEPLFCSKRLCQ
ncbi:hypothetical protein G6F56_012104 [Rhizopus delemar]|uniref:Uncharacterized protein n=1 Tax=Rhizopus stolonifer TaxID=4846 RepID=A0A367INW7_RHIST|nr:hypothetical protein G6F56_012104 [Rhizopus delemar]RCH79343.1 hypothetical protein CU098_005138 [Rhizopus stolonifer]